MGQLEGKVALVTGGSAGIGLETARRFAAEGAQVYLTGRRKEVVDAAVDGIDGDITEEEYDTTFDDNVKVLVFTVQKALPLMPDGASIVLLSSVATVA